MDGFGHPIFPNGTTLGVEVPKLSEILDLIPPECKEYVDKIQAKLEERLSGTRALGTTPLPVTEAPAIQLSPTFVQEQIQALPLRIQQKVVQRLEKLSPRQEWEGTRARPHVFVYGVRDLSGLKLSEQVAYNRVRDRLKAARDQECLTNPQSSRCRNLAFGLQEFDVGNIPFSLFRNLGNQRLWGKFYDRTSGSVEIDQVDLPFPIFATTPKGRVVEIVVLPDISVGLGRKKFDDWIEDASTGESTDIFDAIGDGFEWLGDAIVWIWEVALEVLEILSLLCDLYEEITAFEAVKVARCMIAIAAAMGEPTSAVAGEVLRVADMVCNAVATVEYALGKRPEIEAAVRPGATAEEQEQAEVESAAAAIIRSTLSVPTPTVYPSNAFAIYDPNISMYRILAPIG